MSAAANPLVSPGAPMDHHHSHHLPLQYIDYFDVNGSQSIPITSPTQHATHSPMGEALNSELPYDPRLFSVGPPFGSSAPDANDEGQQHHHTDSMLGFPPSTPWNTWAIAGRPMNPVYPHHNHHVPQLGMMPTVPGMTDFEPLVTTTYDHPHHCVSSTRGTPVSPSQESSSSAMSPSDFQPPMHHRPAQPLDIRFEPPAVSSSSSSKTARSPPGSQTVAEQRLGKRKNSSAADWAVPVPATTGGGAIHATIEALDDASTGPPHASAARRNSSAIAADVADVSSRPESPLPDGHGQVRRRQQSQRAMSLPKNNSSNNSNSSSRPPSAKREHTISRPHRDEPPAVIVNNNNTNNSGGNTNMVVASQRLRNRAAATKCRMKSKVAIAQLEATERVLSDQHSQLSATVTGLRDEVLTLKNEILLHGNCDCDLINHYLRNAARNLGGGARGGPVPTTTAPPLGPDQDHAGQHPGQGSSGWSSATSPTPPGP